ncbi:MAG: hypothetical protein ACU836_14085 [Gammaproteobacteria bacterium]
MPLVHIEFNTPRIKDAFNPERYCLKTQSSPLGDNEKKFLIGKYKIVRHTDVLITNALTAISTLEKK